MKRNGTDQRHIKRRPGWSKTDVAEGHMNDGEPRLDFRTLTLCNGIDKSRLKECKGVGEMPLRVSVVCSQMLWLWIN